MPVAESIKPLLIAAYRIPSVTGYNRLEPSQRTKNFDRSLKAEIRDPLWMLTRQWQFGEFEGDDSGSPVTAQIYGEHTKVDRIAFGGKTVPYDESTPMETTVERMPLRRSLYLSVQIGRYLYKCLAAAGGFGDSQKGKLVAQYPLLYAENNADPLLNIHSNDADGIQLMNAVTGKLPDGWTLLEAVNQPLGTSNAFAQWVAGAGFSAAEQDMLVKASEALTAWYKRTYSQPLPSGATAWMPSQLEYGFSLGAPAENGAFTTLTAAQYTGGHLDWYAFDSNDRSALPETEQKPAITKPEDVFQSFIPSPVSFKGMPNPRFWMMEDNQTDFGKIDTSPTGLLHLLLAEFGLIYGNDWFLLPYQLSVNSLCRVKRLVVTDTFGQHILIQPAGSGPEANWQRWSMFQLTDGNNKGTDGSLFYLPPAISNMQEGEPVEQVQFLRDEMANMVWAVETVLPSQAGAGVNGNELALKEPTDPAFVPVDEVVAIRYLLGTTVPENWIPFMPVHMPGSDTEIRLQRARMPDAKEPAASVLSEVPPPYFINEEEIPRAGITVKQTFQRARWAGGATWLWTGREKQTGKGEGWSNLKFDQIADIKREPA